MAFRPKNFDGNHRNKRKITLGGRSSAVGRKSAVEQAKEARAERAERAAKRAREQASGIIQKHVRGHLGRQKWKSDARQQWLQEFQVASDVEAAFRLIGQLPLFSNLSVDQAHVESACNLITKYLLSITEEQISPQNKLRLKRFAITILKYRTKGPTLEFMIAYCNDKLWSQPYYQELLKLLVKAGVLRFLVPVAHSDSHINAELRNQVSGMVNAALATNLPIVLKEFAFQLLVNENYKSFPIAASSFSVLIKALVDDILAVQSLGQPNPHKGIWLLVNLIELSSRVTIDNDATLQLLRLYCTLVPMIPPIFFQKDNDTESDNEDEEEEDRNASRTRMKILSEEERILFASWQPTIEKLWSGSFIKSSLAALRKNVDGASEVIAKFLNTLFGIRRTPYEKANILNIVAFEPKLVVGLWRLIQKQNAKFGQFQRGESYDYQDFVSLLRVFAAAYSHLLFTQDDDEFFSKNISSGKFSLDDIVQMSEQLKELTAVLFLGDSQMFAMSEVIELRHTLCTLLKQLHRRDSNRQFCPDGHWLSNKTQSLSHLSSVGVDEFKSKISNNQSNSSTRNHADKLMDILKRLPFLVPFSERAKFFQSLVERDQSSRRDDWSHVTGDRFCEIRRATLYDDAFQKLNELGEELRLRLRISMVNEQGMQEAGIDGGGVFREFLDSVIKEGFDLNRGLFRATPEQYIFPNPQATRLHNNAIAQYEFLGKLLGKAMSMGILVELPFASFFLSKLLGQMPFVNDLASLDPEMHKNLLFLRSFEGDCADLSLDFSINTDDSSLAGNIVDLIPNGRNVPVTNENKIRYVYHVANYRLNIQIRQHCAAFRRGLCSLINQEWLMMFSAQELQILISGNESDIDIEDLKNYTNYSGGFHSQHPTIRMFWNVVQGFDKTQRHSLLKFVTSCSRPPLFGFRQLEPSFAIHSAGAAIDRLPTASTCMNLLKMPAYEDELEIRDKLLYAITSGSGFELS